MPRAADSSDSDAGARRFRRTGSGVGAGAFPGIVAKRQRRSGKSVEAALKFALEYQGASSSDDERGAPRLSQQVPAAYVTKEADARMQASSKAKKRAAPTVPLSEVGKKASEALAPSSLSAAREPSVPEGAAAPEVGQPAKQRRRPAREAQALDGGEKAAGAPKRAVQRADSGDQLSRDGMSADVTTSKENRAASANITKADMTFLLEQHDGKVRRRELWDLTRARVSLEAGSPETKGDPTADGESPEMEARFRMKQGALQKKRSGAVESESDVEPDDEQMIAWQRDLDSRRDRGSEDIRTSFSLKPCNALAIRRLDPASFLGKRSLEDGGKLLCDDKGKVNLHFLLATYKTDGKKAGRDEDDEEENGSSLGPAERNHLKWLVKKARQERLVGIREVKQGKISSKRMEAARRSGRYSLLLESNLVGGSGSEDEGPEQDREFAVERLNFSFPESRVSAEARRSDIIAGRTGLRRQVSMRQAEIGVMSSGSVDVHKVQEQLLAPTMSFDWEDKDDDDDEGLEVEVPIETKSADSKRGMFLQQLKRSVSFNQAKKLGPQSRSVTSGLLKPSSTSISRSDSFETGAQASEDGTLQREASLSTTVRSISTDIPVSQSEEPHRDRDVRTPNQGTSEPPGQPPSLASRPEPNADERQQELEVPATRAVGTKEPCERETSAASSAQRQEPQEKTGIDAHVAIATDVKPSGGQAEDSVPGEQLEQEQDTARKVGAQTCLDASDRPSIQAAHVGVEQDPADPPKPDVQAPPMPGETEKIQHVAVEAEQRARNAREVGRPIGANDWLDDISPTAMWGAEPDHANAGTAEGSHANAAGTVLGSRGHDEISPTMPFVPKEQPKASAEISPTMPFVPKYQSVTGAEHASISPTMPFVPREMPTPAQTAAGEISPTLPFVAKDVPAPTGVPVEISPTMPFVPGVQPAIEGETDAAVTPAHLEANADRPAIVGQASLGQSDATHDAVYSEQSVPIEPEQGMLPGTTKSGRGAKRKSATADDESSEHGDVDLAVPGDLEGLDPDEFDERRLRQEREWLRHKKRAERKQALELQQAEKRMRAQQKAADKAKELGTALMSEKERQRLEAVIGGKPTRPNDSGTTDDTEVLGGFQRGRKRSAIFRAK